MRESDQKNYEFLGKKNWKSKANGYEKSPNFERTVCCTAMGPKKMDSLIDLQSKSIYFGEKICFLNLSTSMLLQNVSFWQLHEKVQILKEQFFVEPWDHKNWISHSIYNQNHCVLVKKNFSKFFFKNLKSYDFFGQKSEKVRVIAMKKSKFWKNG